MSAFPSEVCTEDSRSDLDTVLLNARLPKSANHFDIRLKAVAMVVPVAMFVRVLACENVAVVLLASPLVPTAPTSLAV